MTPQEAQQLLDLAGSHGEWELVETEGHEADYIHDKKRNLIFIIGPGSDGTFVSAEGLKLAAAAPELARTVAGLREEYLIEVELPDLLGKPKWICIQGDGHQAAVYPTADAAEHNRQRALELYGALRTRIVRRYVSDPEEVQP